MSMLLIVAAAAVTATPPAQTEGCYFTSATPVEVIIFEDASQTLDAGDLVAAFKLDDNKTSGLVSAPSQTIRYKVRNSPDGAWRWSGKTTCSNGRVVKI
jgi:ABC-type molybdate transport system substrate-binding protein